MFISTEIRIECDNSLQFTCPICQEYKGSAEEIKTHVQNHEKKDKEGKSIQFVDQFS
jgi:hypothetical protein